MTPPDGLFVRRGLVLPEDELVVETSRSGGPGGQNVNKVATRVTLRWNLSTTRVLDEVQRERVRARLGGRVTRSGEVLVHVDESRSQARNRQIARDRLAELLRRALTEPRKRRVTRPTKGSRVRRRASKERRSEVKRQRRRPARDD